MAAQSYSQIRSENIKVLIKEVKIRKHLTNEQLAKKLGMSLSTFVRRQAHPGEFNCYQMWLLAQMVDLSDDDKQKYL